MNRVVMADITLSDGLVLKKGTHIAFPSLQLNMNDQTWDNPEVFDGFRFEKLRAMEGNENKYQFVTTGYVSFFLITPAFSFSDVLIG